MKTRSSQTWRQGKKCKICVTIRTFKMNMSSQKPLRSSHSRMFPKNNYIMNWQGEDPEYIHLCKSWSHICSGKVIKKYRNTRFLLQIILFFSSADRKDWNVFGQRMLWSFCKICWMSLHACHARKTVFPGNIRKFSNIIVIRTDSLEHQPNCRSTHLCWEPSYTRTHSSLPGIKM